MKQRTKNIWVAITFIAGVELIGFLGSLIAGNIEKVYNALNKPPLAPPCMLFGIVWPILFVLIGLSLFFIWKKNTDITRKFYIISAIQLTLNFLWSILFFKYSLHTLALVDLLLLIISVIYLLSISYKANKTSFWMLIPYLLWLIFAAYLNIGFVILN